MNERKTSRETVERLAKCVKALTLVAGEHETRISELERKADRLLKETEDGSGSRS